MLAIAQQPSTDIDLLEKELAELAAHLHAGTARFIELLSEFDAREGWGQWGIKSCAHWLSWRCGFSPMTAREQVRVARAMRTLPILSAVFRSGRLSYSKVRAITRIARPETERILVEWALHATAAQMEKIVRGTAPQPRWKTQLSCTTIGRWIIGSTIAEIWSSARAWRRRTARSWPALSIEQARYWNPQAFPRKTPVESGSTSTPGQRRRADALTMIAESFAANGPRELTPEARALVLVHLGGDRHGMTSAGARLPDETLRRLACDAGVVRIAPDGSIGRHSRAVPAAMRRTLRARDGTCRLPSCSAKRVDAHHIRHWADGGETSISNLVLLCRTHHRFVHERGFCVRARASGDVEFLRPDGTPIRSVTASGSTERLRALNAHHSIDSNTSRSLRDTRQPDYDIAVGGLFSLERSP